MQLIAPKTVVISAVNTGVSNTAFDLVNGNINEVVLLNW
jgi:hypothetical protein